MFSSSVCHCNSYVSLIRLEVKSEVTQSCPTLCDPIDHSLSGSSVHGISQARVLQWIAISFSRGLSASFNFMAAVTICSDFRAQKNKVWHYFHCFPIYFPWNDGTGCHDLNFLNVNFKPTFSLFCFTFMKRLFSFSLLSAIRVVSSAYLRLLIFLPAILIPACASFSPVFLLMYSAYKLNKQGDNIQPFYESAASWGSALAHLTVSFSSQLKSQHSEN